MPVCTAQLGYACLTVVSSKLYNETTEENKLYNERTDWSSRALLKDCDSKALGCVVLGQGRANLRQLKSSRLGVGHLSELKC